MQISRNIYRTHLCKDIDETKIEETVRISGWIRKKRDHGPIIFIDLVDASSLVQCVIEKNNETEKMFSIAHKLSHESVISVEGKVIKRSEKSINPKLSSGKVELLISKLEILSQAQELPFALYQPDLSEELQLRYRFLYLRQKEMQEMLMMRAKIIKLLRQYMEELNFIEVQTPLLSSSSPEGARDYVVPSRLHPGKFYALPQAPQQFKQLLMASGIEKYYQIAPCFRDEDARADRLVGEFYQLDFEMAYATQEDIFDILEHVLYNLFHTICPNYKINKKFPRIPYKEAIAKYGSDKPDLRNPLEITDITNEHVPEIFTNLVQDGGKLLVISAKIENQSNSFFEELTKHMMHLGAKGLAYCVFKDKWSGPLAKMLSDETKNKILKHEHNAIFLIADKKDMAYKLAGQLRTQLGNKLNLIDQETFAFCFITDFPMFELSDGKWDFMHNPFSKPQNIEAPIEEILAYQYDTVCNGYELSSGAVRNHDLEMVKQIFTLIGDNCENLEERFPLYKAFKYGVPPHAGSAPGIDRIIMLLCKKTNVRDIVAFPLNQNGQSLLMEAPSKIDEKLLKELKIKVFE